MSGAQPIISAAAAGYQTRQPWGGSELVIFTLDFEALCGGPIGYLPVPSWAKKVRVSLVVSDKDEGKALGPFVVIERTTEQQPWYEPPDQLGAVLGTAINTFSGPIELELTGVERLVIVSPNPIVLISFQFWG